MKVIKEDNINLETVLMDQTIQHKKNANFPPNLLTDLNGIQLKFWQNFL